MIPFEPKTFTLGEKLTDEQLWFFNKYGFLHFKHFISKDTVKQFLSEAHRIEKDWLEAGLTKMNGIPLKFGKNPDGASMIQRLCFLSQNSQILHEYLKDPRLKALTQLLGYDARIGENEKDGLVFNHYVNAENSKFTQMGWHTDSPRDLFLGQKILKMLNVGTHLDDCPKENGGLRVLPGTHNQSRFKLLFGKKQFIDHRPDPNEVGLDIEAGDLTVHDGDLWHRVEVCPFTGENSRRRVMYIPIVTGKYAPKDAGSKTPFYHRLAKVVQF
ncbi:phytanoyl-CoA dioxygenase family protein [Pseudarcicella hirudinis]|nr:phytanoyl-CoA dioxygenase family protein [Pseudarcicella hirudinis]